MLNRKTYFIREHVGLLKLSDTYDILDPETKQQLGIAQEKPGLLMHLLRLVMSKQVLPTKVMVYEGSDPEDESKLLFTLQRGFKFLRSKIDILDKQGNCVGWLKSKLLTLGGAFTVYDSAGNEAAEVKGDWKGWNFRFLDKAGNELGAITKKWAGIGKELFTTADCYMVSLNCEPSPAQAVLLIAASLAIDIVYKETD
jgi:uncharacterized protein YxjI